MKALVFLVEAAVGVGLVGLGVFCGHLAWAAPLDALGHTTPGAFLTTAACLGLFYAGSLVLADAIDRAEKA